jgi:hypothetical protein
MDQLKTQLAAVKQHSFWVMCVGILLVSLGSWWYSTGTLKSQKDAQLADITTQYTALQTVAGTQLHPNQKVIEGMDALNRNYALEVLKGWQLQYDQQAGVLVWPGGEDGFSDRFREKVDKLRPIEAIPVTGNGQVPFSHDLERDLKEEYRNFLEPVLPNLAKTIGAKWMVSTFGVDPSGAGGGMAGSMPGGGMPGAMPMGGGLGGGEYGGGTTPQLDANGVPILDDSIVIWDPANQQEILMTHFGFVAKAGLPTTLEVLYAQEDYWVLDNIMHIIAATNGDATARHEAIIKKLDFVRIGRSAGQLAGRIQRLGMSMAGGEMAAGGMAPMPGGEGSAGAAPDMAAGGGSADGGMMPGGGGEGGMGMGMESVYARDPAEGRYVDEKYQILPAARLRGALTSKTPEDALLAVAKRMPVRIRCWMDQRKLNVLLAQCGNSKLPVEIRQVRINREPAAVGTGMGGAGGYGGMAGGGEGYAPGGGGGGGMGGFGGGGGSGFGGGMGGGGMGGGGFGGGGGMGSSDGGYGGGFGGMMGGGGMPGGGMGGMGGMGGTGRAAMTPGSVTQDSQVDPNLVPVELYGVVYIYNPVNKSQLGLDTPAPAPADGMTPADGAEPGAEGAPAVAPPTEAVDAAPPATPPAAQTTGGGSAAPAVAAVTQ